MKNSLKDTLSKNDVWLRFLGLIFFGFIFVFVGAVVLLIALVQFAVKLATNKTNPRLEALGGDLGSYVRAIVSFATYHANVTPYPFSPWPGSAQSSPAQSLGEKAPTKKTAKTGAGKKPPARRRGAAKNRQKISTLSSRPKPPPKPA